MSDFLSRRRFLESTGAVVAAAALPGTVAASPAAPAIILRPPSKPVAISSSNSMAPVTRTVELVMSGSDTLDAAVEGVKIQELDPTDS